MIKIEITKFERDQIRELADRPEPKLSEVLWVLYILTYRILSRVPNWRAAYNEAYPKKAALL
jgi:hypothetical protein